MAYSISRKPKVVRLVLEHLKGKEKQGCGLNLANDVILPITLSVINV